MKLLVTGGAGFIGSNFIRHILQAQPKAQVLNFDALTYSGNQANLRDLAADKRYHFQKGDIANERQVERSLKEFKPTHVINFAAESHVDRSIHGAAADFLQTNAAGVLTLLEGIKKYPVEQFVQVSTDEIYGSLTLSSKKKFTEATPFAPNSPYAASKAAGDLLCRAYVETWGLPVIVTHCSNNYGPYQYPEKLIPFFITRILANKPVTLYGDGKNVRDWLYVEDHCEALLLVLAKGQPGERYNIGGNTERSNYEIAKQLLHYFDKDESWISYITDRPGHDRRYAIDSTKIRRELGWKPQHSFDHAFTKTIEWYLDNRSWLKKLEKKHQQFNKHNNH